MIKFLKSKSGVTLVELIIGLLLISIFTLMTSSLLPPALRILASTKETSDTYVLVNNLGEYFTNEITHAVSDDLPTSSMSIIPKDTLSIEKKDCVEQTVFSLSSTADPQGQGYLLKNGNMVYDSAYYKGYVITSLVFIKDHANKYITVSFSLSGKQGTSKTVTIKPYYYK